MSVGIRLIAIGAVAALVGFGVASALREGSGARALPTFPESMSEEQMRVAMGEVLLEPDTFQRALEMNALLARLDTSNVAGAEAAIDPIVNGVDDCDLQAYFQMRATFDPEGAFREAMAWSSVHKRSVALHAVFLSWALRGGALEGRTYVESIDSAILRQAAFTGLSRGWVREDVDGATAYLMNLPDDPNGTRDRVYMGYITSSLLSYGGPDRLIAWFEDIPEDAPNDFKRAAYQNLLLQLAYEDPEQAAAFHASNETRAYADKALWLIAIAWQRQEPVAAFDWLLGQPDSPGRKMAFSRAMTRWYSRQARAAAQWVAQADLEDDPELRRLLYGITRQGLRRTAPGAGT